MSGIPRIVAKKLEVVQKCFQDKTQKWQNTLRRKSKNCTKNGVDCNRTEYETLTFLEIETDAKIMKMVRSYLCIMGQTSWSEWLKLQLGRRIFFYARIKKNPLYKIVQWSSIGTSICFCPCNPICFDVSTFLDPTKVKLRWQRGETENISRRTRNWTHHSNFFYRISLVCKVIRMRRRMKLFFSKKNTS